MPLPVLPPNNTARVFMDYTSAGIAHTLMFRLGAGATPADAVSKAHAAADVLITRMIVSDAFTAVRFCNAHSLISLPVAWAPVSGTVSAGGGSALWAEDPESAFVSFVGRGTTTGRRTRWEFFTSIKTEAWPLTNRYLPGSSAPIETLRLNWTTFIEEGLSTGEQVVTVGGDIPIVYGYVNIAKNAYWQRQQR